MLRILRAETELQSNLKTNNLHGYESDVAIYKQIDLLQESAYCFSHPQSIKLHQDQMSTPSPKRQQRQHQSRSRSRQRRETRQFSQADRNHRDKKPKLNVPELNTYLYSYKQFANLQKQRTSSENMSKAYDKYKKDWEQRQKQQFFKQHKKDPWFTQRYDPEVLDLIQRDRRQNCRKNYVEFIGQLNNGFYDKLDLRVKDASLLGVIGQLDEQKEQNSNLGQILNHTFQIHLKQSIEISNQPLFGFNQDQNTLFIKSVPRAVSRYDIKAIVQKLQGYKGLAISEPNKKMNLNRCCWIQFQNQQSCSKAELPLCGLMIKDEAVLVSRSINSLKRVKVLKNYPISRIEKDIQTLCKLVAKLDQEVGIQSNQLLVKPLKDPHFKLDILLLYLRKVHAYDYYTSLQYQNERILALKTCNAFLRMDVHQQQLENFENVFQKIQQKAQERIQKGHQAIDYMGLLRQQMEDFIRETQKIGKEQQKDVWKCMECEKKFKTCQFLAKHLIAKHEDIKLQKIQPIMWNLYLQDPQKITSFGDRDQKYKRPFANNYRQRNRQYHDFDDPDNQTEGKGTSSVGMGKQLLNFLDI